MDVARQSPLLPHALAPQALAGLRERLARGGPTLFLIDYDGTLSPIVSSPDAAVLEQGMGATLERLLARFPHTVVITGRSVERIRGFLGPSLGGRIQLAASHGHDLAGPFVNTQIGAELLLHLAAAASAMKRRLQWITGVTVEDNRFSVSVHFRNAAPDRVGEVKAAVARYISDVGAPQGLAARDGNCVVELRPSEDTRRPWDKGRAATLLAEALGMNTRDATIVVLGDDLTDEDMFAAVACLRARSVAVIVADDAAAAGATTLSGGSAAGSAPTAAAHGCRPVRVPRATAATCALRSPAEVREFLDALASTPTKAPSPA